MARLLGNMGIGHVRYPTAGCASVAEAQPFYVNSPYGIIFAHNGNLTNVAEIVESLFETDMRHLNTTSDSEVMLNVFAHAMARRGAVKPNEFDVFAAVEEVHRRCKGGYAVIAMIAGVGMIAFRDLHGIRPLVFGIREEPGLRFDKGGREYMFASESVALQVSGFQLEHDLAPGEVIFIDMEGEVFRHQSLLAHEAGLRARRRVRLPVPHQHGREAGGEDQARVVACAHRCGDSDSLHQPHCRAGDRDAAEYSVP
jgi:amidophosphoribosyltransferase